MFKIGIGYDIHRFAPKRKLVLGGVVIPYKKGLLGHSDADVLLHAVCDALLSALGQKDIGRLFPNTDSRYKNISSLKLLGKVKAMLDKKDFFVGNIGAVILMEAPKISSYADAMKKNIAKVLKIDESCVGITATTQEGVGEIGRNNAAAAHAVALIQQKRVDT
ncbi:MAG TPA: 2-C-methyl-D-erythritol 2,4-cyclodiphosphate synthase [Candidatus Omnitrophica bacterium]|nr:2-C-methyl-D-erythritol 2,4-cyclodiphosphate synthase [Candidatus Omnitrophota bacterium]